MSTIFRERIPSTAPGPLSLESTLAIAWKVPHQNPFRGISGGLRRVAGGLGVGIARWHPTGVEEAGRPLLLRLPVGLLPPARRRGSLLRRVLPCIARQEMSEGGTSGTRETHILVITDNNNIITADTLTVALTLMVTTESPSMEAAPMASTLLHPPLLPPMLHENEFSIV